MYRRIVLTTALAVALPLGVGVFAAGAQGFSGVVDKLSQLETRLAVLETDEAPVGAARMGQLEARQTSRDREIEQVTEQLTGLAAGQAGVQSAIARIDQRVDGLEGQLQRVTGSGGGDTESVRLLAMDLGGLVDELRRALAARPGLETGAGVEPRATAISVEVGADGYSQYVWRGFVLADALTMQPSVTLGFGDSGVALNVWGSVAMQDRRSGGLEEVDEMDFTLSYDGSLGGDGTVGLSAGFIQYTFPNLTGTQHSEEIYGGLSLDHPLGPSLTAHYDYGLADAWYIAAGAGHDFALARNGDVSLSVGTSLGFSNAARSFGFSDVTTAASVSLHWEGLTLCPTVGFSYADEAVNSDHSAVWGGVALRINR